MLIVNINDKEPEIIVGEVYIGELKDDYDRIEVMFMVIRDVFNDAYMIIDITKGSIFLPHPPSSMFWPSMKAVTETIHDTVWHIRKVYNVTVNTD